MILKNLGYSAELSSFFFWLLTRFPPQLITDPKQLEGRVKISRKNYIGIISYLGKRKCKNIIPHIHSISG